MLSFQSHYGLINVCGCVRGTCVCVKIADQEEIPGKDSKMHTSWIYLHHQKWNRKTCSYLFQENEWILLLFQVKDFSASPVCENMLHFKIKNNGISTFNYFQLELLVS